MKNNFATAVCVKLELEVAEAPQSQTGQYPAVQFVNNTDEGRHSFSQRVPSIP